MVWILNMKNGEHVFRTTLSFNNVLFTGFEGRFHLLKKNQYAIVWHHILNHAARGYIHILLEQETLWT